MNNTIINDTIINKKNQEQKESVVKKSQKQHSRDTSLKKVKSKTVAKTDKKAKAMSKCICQPISNEEIKRRTESIIKDLKPKTWRDLETKGKFGKDEKLSFITDDMLIVGCDIGSEKHYIRAIDTKGRELSVDKKAFGHEVDAFSCCTKQKKANSPRP